jgi:hypothetical protein
LGRKALVGAVGEASPRLQPVGAPPESDAGAPAPPPESLLAWPPDALPPAEAAPDAAPEDMPDGDVPVSLRAKPSPDEVDPPHAMPSRTRSSARCWVDRRREGCTAPVLDVMGMSNRDVRIAWLRSPSVWPICRSVTDEEHRLGSVCAAFRRPVLFQASLEGSTIFTPMSACDGGRGGSQAASRGIPCKRSEPLSLSPNPHSMSSLHERADHRARSNVRIDDHVEEADLSGPTGVLTRAVIAKGPPGTLRKPPVPVVSVCIAMMDGST